MPNSRFQICGSSIPAMLGRKAQSELMISALTKPTPDHLQVVGARFAGKSVMLNDLAKKLRSAGRTYSAVFVWDLGHLTPSNDDAFLKSLARELAEALPLTHAVYSEHLRSIDRNPYSEIAEILDALKDDGGKILAILDGFDRALASGSFTRNLWDQMRELAARPNLRLVTASRRTLRELIRSPDAQTSDFWNIFSTIPIRVSCFDDDDLDAVLKFCPEFELEPGARTELWNATNGFPVLMLAVLNVLSESGTTRRIDAKSMRAACDASYSAVQDILDTLWTDCPPTSQDLFRRVLEVNEMARNEAASADVDSLLERGFATLQRNVLKRPNGLLGRFLNAQPNESGSMSRLFDSEGAYRKNLRNVLQRRLAQIENLNSSLKRFLERGVEDLPDHPEVFLRTVRGIEDVAFDLIWDVEVPNRKIPSEWIAIWKRNKEPRAMDFETAFPQGAARLRLLNLMTGSELSSPCASRVTKRTYHLLSAAHGFGNFGQHIEGAPVDAHLGYAVMYVCTELAGALTKELREERAT